MKNIEIKRENMFNATKKGFLLATDVADYLVTKGLAFREAHKKVGEMVNHCQKAGKELETLSLEEMRRFCPLIENDIKEVLDVTKAVSRRRNYGGTSPEEVRRQIEVLKKELL